ncbi:MAG TPA: hypothetical protein VGJ86_08890 [Acidimicrobiales bacterium]
MTEALADPRPDVSDDDGAPGGEEPVDDNPSAPAGSKSGWSRQRTALFLGGLTAAVVGLPMAVALGVLHQPRWYPLLDLAQTELRVRDVGNGHPPLVGLAGRIGGVDPAGHKVQGSHPGPISFWALWPFYQLFGGDSWSLQAASACLSTIAVGLSLWISHRRLGRIGALAAALALAVLVQSYGADKLTEAWNPYLPMLWWVVLLLAVWSVLCDDITLLPLAIFAGTFCMQTHIPYAGLVLGMWLVTAVVVGGQLRRPRPELRRTRVARWSLGSLALLVILWIPPIIDQLTNEVGNLSLIKQTFTDPPEGYDGSPVGLGSHAFQIWLAHLNPWGLLKGTSSTMAEAVADTWMPGLVVLGVWLVAVVVAWRMRPREPQLLRLHLVTGAALVFGLISISRILGFVWYYLTLWAWGTTALVIAVTLWTFVRAWWLRAPAATTTAEPEPRRWLAAHGWVVIVAPLVATSVWFVRDAAYTEVPAATESRILRHVAAETVEALNEPGVVGGGKDGHYLLVWSDQLTIGAQGFGMLDELERAGFDVGVDAPYGTGAVDHRVLDRDEATAVIQHIVGPGMIERWRNTPGAVEIAYYEPRTAQQRVRFLQLHDEVEAGFRQRGLDKLAEDLDGNLLSTALAEDTPRPLALKIQEMMSLGLPSAVFLTPTDLEPAPAPS